ncbi:histidine kinase [Paenibacillus rhizoplanae]
MLDTIFWEAEAAGQDKISEMVINLSRLFRLSLNQGKSFTSVAKEKKS